VIATQNPVEQAGTFELPEAQLDRFMLLHRLGYLTVDQEKEVLRRNAALGVRRDGKGAVARTEFDVLGEAGHRQQRAAGARDGGRAAGARQRGVPRAHVEIVNRTRKHPKLELGCSPRAGISLVKASRARALIHGRDYVLPEDLFALAEDVILHRIRLTYEAVAEGFTSQQVLQEILGEVAR
jgi:MoxR-like ATPase